MAYSSRSGGQGRPRSSSQRRPQNGSRGSRNTRQRSSSSRPSRSGSSRSGSRSRNLTGPDTGYTLHSHRVNYSRRGGGMGDRLNARFLVLIAIVIVVIVVLITGIASCVRGSSTTTTDTQQQTDQQEEKPRVASGISSELSQEFTEALDRNDQLAQIAQNADQYTDTRLLELALNEPDAISFVANYLTADKSGSSYGDTVTKGQVPLLYDWDTRWGYVSYGDGCIGVTGSGPTTVAMAYMGLTGNSDKTPATIAQGAQASSSSSGTSTSSSSSSSSSSTSSSDVNSVETVTQLMTSAGLSATQYESSSDTLVACLSDSSVAAVLIKDDGLIQNTDAHWALVVGMNSDGSLNVFDPTSTEVSTLTWSSSTIANASSTILYVTVSDTTTSESDTEGNTTSGTTTSSSDSDTASSTSGGTTSNGTSTSGTSSSGSSGSNSSSSSSQGSTSSTTTTTSDSSDYVGL